MRRIGKRLTAIGIAAALTLTNIGNTLSTVYAASGGEHRDLSVRGADLAGAIMDMIRGLDGSQKTVQPDELEFSQGRVEKYNRLFFEGTGSLYEFYPEIDGQDQEASVRTFIRLPEDADASYELTGDEQLVFLYENGGESSISFSTAVEHENGKIQKTSRVSVKSYKEAFIKEDNYLKDEQEKPQESETQAGESVSEGKTAADETSAEPETARTEHTEETLTEQKEAVGDTKSSAETEQSEGELLNSKAHDAQTDGMDSDAVVSTEAVTAQTPESETQSELASTDGSQPETETSTAEESQSQTEENASLPETEASTGESASKDMEQPSQTETASGESETESDSTAQTPVQSTTQAETKGEIQTTVPATPSEPQKDPAATPSQPEDNGNDLEIGYGDLVGIGESVTAKAYITSVGKLKLLEDWKMASYPEFDETMTMDDGTDIALHAEAGVLPAGAKAVVSKVNEDEASGLLEEIRENRLKKGQAVTAAALYEIRFYADGEPMDDSAWSKNGRVEVCFSGTAIEEMSREADGVKVLQISDSIHEAKALKGTKTAFSNGKTTDEVAASITGSGFFGPVFYTVDESQNREFNIGELLGEGSPKLIIKDKSGTVIDTAEVDEDGVTKIYQNQKDEEGNYLPLPRELTTSFQITYGMENSSDPELKGYAVKKGDRFVYQLPDNIIYDTKTDTPVMFGDKVVGSLNVEQNGILSIDITENVGANFKGQLTVKGSVDFSKEPEGKPEIEIKNDDLDKTLVFPEIKQEKHYSITIKKDNSGDRFTDENSAGDLHYSDTTGIPDAVRFHLKITADAKNTGALTNPMITDRFSEIENGAIEYIDTAGIRLESTPEGSNIAKAEFDNTGSSDSRAIRLLDQDGNPAVMKPGEEVKLSYWMKINPSAWKAQQPEQTENGNRVSSSMRASFTNTAVITAAAADTEGGTVQAQTQSWFGKTISLVSKNGTVRINETVGDQTIPFSIQYNVSVNPNLIDMTGWTVKDTLPEVSDSDKQQHYVGAVKVTAYDRENGNVSGETTVPVERDSYSWEYTIPKELGRCFLQFTYYTDIQEPSGSNASNEILLTAPEGSGYPGTRPGSTSIECIYNTYTLTKTTTGWQDGKLGIIGWKAVLTQYVNGQINSEDAVIPVDGVYSDELSVSGGDGSVKHTFIDESTLKQGLSVKDRTGSEVSDYEVENFADNRFAIKFTKAVPSPVTIEYRSYVRNTGESGDSFYWSSSQSASFKNRAILKPNKDTTVQAEASQSLPAAKGFLRKGVEGQDAQTGTIKWILEGNAYDDKVNFDAVGDVLIEEKLPEGLELVNIYPRAYQDVTLRAGEDYTVDGQTVKIDLKKARDYVRSKGKDFNINHVFRLVVETRVNDPKKTTFKNEAAMHIDGIELARVGAEAQLKTNFLIKGMMYDEYTAPSAQYTLSVNQPASQLRKDGGTLTVRDTLGNPNMSFRPKTIKVVNSKTKAAIEEAKIAVNGSVCTISNLPDATPITITYEAALNGAIGTEFNVSNHAELIYGPGKSIETEHKDTITLVQSSASVTGDYSIELSKTDQWGQPLEGAEFTLYELQLDGDGRITGQSDPIGTYEPVIQDGSQSANVAIGGLKSGKAYRLVETKVPDGYIQSEAMDVYIPTGTETKLPENMSHYIYIPGFPVSVENQKQTGSLKLTKQVNGQETDRQEKTEFYFTVTDGVRYFDRNGNASEEVKTIRLAYDPAKEENALMINGLPLGTYTVTEAANAAGSPIEEDFGYQVTADGREGTSAEAAVQAGKTQTVIFVNTVKNDPPEEPETKPSQPETKPSQPETDPSQPETDPSQPETDPSQPETDPSQPETEAPTSPETSPAVPDGGHSGGSGGSGGGSGTTNHGRHNPSNGGPGDNTETVTIAPEEVPLAQWPDKQDDPVILFDEDVPLAPLPKTGENRHGSHVMFLLSSFMTGVYLALHLKKRKE